MGQTKQKKEEKIVPTLKDVDHNKLFALLREFTSTITVDYGDYSKRGASKPGEVKLSKIKYGGNAFNPNLGYTSDLGILLGNYDFGDRRFNEKYFKEFSKFLKEKMKSNPNIIFKNNIGKEIDISNLDSILDKSLSDFSEEIKGYSTVFRFGVQDKGLSRSCTFPDYLKLKEKENAIIAKVDDYLKYYLIVTPPSNFEINEEKLYVKMIKENVLPNEKKILDYLYNTIYPEIIEKLNANNTIDNKLETKFRDFAINISKTYPSIYENFDAIAKKYGSRVEDIGGILVRTRFKYREPSHLLNEYERGLDELKSIIAYNINRPKQELELSKQKLEPLKIEKKTNTINLDLGELETFLRKKYNTNIHLEEIITRAKTNDLIKNLKEFIPTQKNLDPKYKDELVLLNLLKYYNSKYGGEIDKVYKMLLYQGDENIDIRLNNYRILQFNQQIEFDKKYKDLINYSQKNIKIEKKLELTNESESSMILDYNSFYSSLSDFFKSKSNKVDAKLGIIHYFSVPFSPDLSTAEVYNYIKGEAKDAVLIKGTNDRLFFKKNKFISLMNDYIEHELSNYNPSKPSPFISFYLGDKILSKEEFEKNRKEIEKQLKDLIPEMVSSFESILVLDYSYRNNIISLPQELIPHIPLLAISDKIDFEGNLEIREKERAFQERQKKVTSRNEQVLRESFKVKTAPINFEIIENLSELGKKISKITEKELQNLTDEQLRSLTIDQLNVLSAEKLKTLSKKQIKVLADSVVKRDDMVYLDDSVIEILDTSNSK